MNQADTVGLIVGSAAHDLCIHQDEHHPHVTRTLADEVQRNYTMWCDLMKSRGDFATLDARITAKLALMGFEVVVS